MNPTLKKILKLLYLPYELFVFVPLMALCSVSLTALAIVLLACGVSQRRVNFISAVNWARWCAHITPMFVRVRGREHIDPQQSYVVVSNHQSHFDIFVIYGWLGIDLRWVLKKELRKAPVIGLYCEKIGSIYLDRANREAAIASINEAKQRIVNGTSIIFFPEGTRSMDGTIAEFKKGAFNMALDLGIPVLPLTVNNTRKVLPSKSLRMFPGCVNMVVHKPIPTTGYTADTIDQLIKKTRDVIISGQDNTGGIA